MNAKTLISLLMLAGVLGGAGAEQAGQVWTIGERTLPPPEAASPLLKMAIGETATPDPDFWQQVPESDEQWLELLTAREAEGGPPNLELAKALGVVIRRDVIDGVKVYHLTPAETDPRHQNHLFLFVHGGAYVFGGGDTGITEGLMIASRSGMPVLSIDYRMPPNHPFPAAVDDVATVYRALLNERPAASMALGGTSAGGGLTLASVLRFKELGLKVPGALYAGTPWADLTKTSDSLFTNEGIDRVLPVYEGRLESAALLYADGKNLKEPLISPLYGDFAGFPPTYLLTGTRDLLLSDTVRAHRKLRQAGVTADLNVYEGMSHAGYMVSAEAPESGQAYAELKDFLLKYLKP